MMTDKIRKVDLAARLADLDDRLRRLEAWVTDEERLACYKDWKLKTAVVDHEGRLRHLEAWVAGTGVETEDGVSYPLAYFVAPWADPKDAARLFSPDNIGDLAQLIYGGDPFAGLPEEAVPAAAAMRARQEAYLAGDDPFAGPGPFELEEPEWQLEAVAARPVDLG